MINHIYAPRNHTVQTSDVYLDPKYFPFISRIALAQSMGSKNDTNP
jgi:hypothetical protein